MKKQLWRDVKMSSRCCSRSPRLEHQASTQDAVRHNPGLEHWAKKPILVALSQQLKVDTTLTSPSSLGCAYMGITETDRHCEEVSSAREAEQGRLKGPGELYKG